MFDKWKAKAGLVKYLFGFLIFYSGLSFAKTTLDIMVLYPQHYADKFVSIDAMVELEVASANQAFANSGMTTRLSLSYQGVLNLSADTMISKGLLTSIGGYHRLAFGNSHKVTELRNKHRPDLTVYVSASDEKWCGWGFTPDPREKASASNGVEQAYQPMYREKAFFGTSVVSLDPQCLGALVHEVGHNLGAGHSERQEGEAGFHHGFPYRDSRGWGMDYIFSTLMAYNTDYFAPNINRFANPAKKDCTSSGLRCGSETSNTAAYIDLFADEFAQSYSSCYPVVKRGYFYECGNNVCASQARNGQCVEWQ